MLMDLLLVDDGLEWAGPYVTADCDETTVSSKAAEALARFHWISFKANA